ncbi:MAG: hypothetical protein R3F11_21275 [Verrucomicrobiales bacterium]
MQSGDWEEGALTVFRCRFSNNGAGPITSFRTNGSAISLPAPAGVSLRESYRIVRVIDSRFAATEIIQAACRRTDFRIDPQLRLREQPHEST